MASRVGSGAMMFGEDPNSSEGVLPRAPSAWGDLFVVTGNDREVRSPSLSACCPEKASQSVVPQHELWQG